MQRRPFTRQRLSLWTRLAVWLGFLAVLSALAAPASMLAEEVRTGKLGGLCMASMGAAGTADASADTGFGDAPPSGSHCDWCGSPALALPPPALDAIPCFAGFQVATADAPSSLAASIPGLPFSRGPPPALN